MRIQIDKQLIIEATKGAWDIDIKHNAESRNMKNAAARENFKSNPGQYFVNFYIRGPLSHLSSEAYGKVAELVYTVFKNSKSSKIKSVQEFQKELKKIKGPWNREKKALSDALDHTDKSMSQIKSNNFIQWMINPFISGDINAKMNYIRKEDLKLLMNKYGDGTGKNAQKEIDSSRDIEHKRAMDVLANKNKQ